MMMFGPGLWMSLPCAFIFACHLRFRAMPPSMMASDEPVVAVPMGVAPLGWFQRPEIIDWHRQPRPL